MRTLIVLEVVDDRDDREWWQAMGLPDPAKWSAGDDAFGAEVFVDVRIEETVL